LHGVEAVIGRNALDGCDRSAIGVQERNQATVDQLAVDDDRARAALAFSTSFFRPSQLQIATEGVE
jgi:hypothetical protein